MIKNAIANFETISRDRRFIDLINQARFPVEN